MNKCATLWAMSKYMSRIYLLKRSTLLINMNCEPCMDAKDNMMISKNRD